MKVGDYGLLWGLLWGGVLAGCTPSPGQVSPLPEAEKRQQIHTFPLPGGLDTEPMLNSNRPERLESQGVILSTLPAPAALPQADRPGHFLDQGLQGNFTVFAHHVVRTAVGDSRQFQLGLLAHNRSDQPLTLKRLRGQAFITRPDAPFIDLPLVQPNPDSKVFAGPGDRLSGAVLQPSGSLPAQSWQLAAGETQLLMHWQVPTNPLWFIQQDNGLSARFEFESSAEVRLSWVALLQNAAPRLSDYQALLDSGQSAGPAETEATLYDPQTPPSGGAFRYGRVAGLQAGSRWQGEIQLSSEQQQVLSQGQAVGWPVSALYLKRFETGQNQSAPLLARVPGSALEAHGNYAVLYQLRLKLENPSASPQTYTLAWGHPLSYKGGQADFVVNPRARTTFRGSLKISGADQQKIQHLVLKEGSLTPPLWEQPLKPQASAQLTLEWMYPPDCTPPQLLILKAKSEL